MSSPYAELWQRPEILDHFARRHYRDDLEFHNYSHALLTAHFAESLAAQAIPHGADIQEDVLRTATRNHDDGSYLWPGVDHPFPTREAYAADVSGRDLRMLGMPQALIDLNGEVIESTNHTVPCATDTARCARQADLIAGGILAEDVVFVNGTYRIFMEAKRIKKEAPPTDESELIKQLVAFGSGVSHEIMLAYAEEDIALGDHQRDDDGGSTFNRLATQKITVLEPEPLERLLTARLDEIVRYQPIEYF